MKAKDISVNNFVMKFVFSFLVFGLFVNGVASASTGNALVDAQAASQAFNSFQIRTKTNDPDREQREQVLEEFSSAYTLSVLQDLKDTGERERWDGNLMLFISLAIQRKQ